MENEDNIKMLVVIIMSK